MLLALVCAAGSIWWGFDLAQTYGTSPGDGGVTAPLAARLAWGVGVGALGVLFAVGMWLYGRCYVTKMELDQWAGKLYVHTVRFFGTRRHAFDVSGVLGSNYHEGKLDSDLAPSVDAPWTSVSLAGQRLPLIVDQQGEFLQQELMDELFRSASPPASS